MNPSKKKGLSQHQKRYFALLGRSNSIAVHPMLSRLFGYPLGIMVSQLLYWQDKGSNKEGYIYKTEADFVKELGLSAAQQRGAIKRGKELGFLEVKRKSIPAKRHYKLDFEKLINASIKAAELKGLVLSKSWFELGEKHGSITKNTHKTTSYSKNSVEEVLIKRQNSYKIKG